MIDPDAAASELVRENFTEQVRGERDGKTAVISCPECGGTLWQLRDGDFIHFMCHVGHRFAPDALLIEQTEALEQALWTCVRLLQERALLCRQLAHRTRREGQAEVAASFEETARADQAGMGTIRQFIASAALSIPKSVEPVQPGWTEQELPEDPA
jgi:two-component system chemotaxis response regulator CheB